METNMNNNVDYTDKLIESLKSEVEFLKRMLEHKQDIIEGQDKQISLLIGNEVAASGSVSFLKIVR